VDNAIVGMVSGSLPLSEDDLSEEDEREGYNAGRTRPGTGPGTGRGIERERERERGTRPGVLESDGADSAGDTNSSMHSLSLSSTNTRGEFPSLSFHCHS
jgi:hypothetical protein